MELTSGDLQELQAKILGGSIENNEQLPATNLYSTNKNLNTTKKDIIGAINELLEAYEVVTGGNLPTGDQALREHMSEITKQEFDKMFDIIKTNYEATIKNDLTSSIDQKMADTTQTLKKDIQNKIFDAEQVTKKMDEEMQRIHDNCMATKKGEDGASAYEIYKRTVKYPDKPMTEEEWLESLHGKNGVNGNPGQIGPQGPRGEQGIQGIPGPIGPQGPQGDPGIQGKQGIPGRDGRDGKDGESAFNVAVRHGFLGTEEEWLDKAVRGPRGLKGDRGPRGERGPIGERGPKGETGSSIYEVAVKNGFQGTETQWLESMQHANSAKVLEVPRAINGVAFDGSADIEAPASKRYSLEINNDLHIQIGEKNKGVYIDNESATISTDNDKIKMSSGGVEATHQNPNNSADITSASISGDTGVVLEGAPITMNNGSNLMITDGGIYVMNQNGTRGNITIGEVTIDKDGKTVYTGGDITLNGGNIIMKGNGIMQGTVKSAQVAKQTQGTLTIDGKKFDGSVSVEISTLQADDIDNKLKTGFSDIRKKILVDDQTKFKSELIPKEFDFIHEYKTRNNFPVLGEAVKLYVDKEKNNIYRYDTEKKEYVLMNQSVALANEALVADKLKTPVKINEAEFDGSADIKLDTISSKDYMENDDIIKEFEAVMKDTEGKEHTNAAVAVTGTEIDEMFEFVMNEQSQEEPTAATTEGE